MLFIKKNISVLLFLIFNIAVLIGSILQPYFGERADSPGTFPAVISAIMIIISLRLLLENIRKSKNNQESIINDINFKVLGIFLLIVIIYILLLGHINFLVLSFLVLVSLMLVLHAGNILKTIFLSLIMMAVLQFIFGYVFKVVLP